MAVVAARHRPGRCSGFRRPGTRLGYLFIRRYLFGRDDADPAIVRQVQDLLEQAPFTVSAAFYPTLLSHDEFAALPVLRAVPVTVLVRRQRPADPGEAQPADGGRDRAGRASWSSSPARATAST